MAKTISDMTAEISKFCSERGWKNFDPNHLITSVLIELGELSEHYQWKSKFEDWDETKKREVGFEFVDIIFYLFLIAKESGIDIEKSFYEKLPLLKKKFKPGEDSSEAHREYRRTGKNKLYK